MTAAGSHCSNADIKKMRMNSNSSNEESENVYEHLRIFLSLTSLTGGSVR